MYLIIGLFFLSIWLGKWFYLIESHPITFPTYPIQRVLIRQGYLCTNVALVTSIAIMTFRWYKYFFKM